MTSLTLNTATVKVGAARAAGSQNAKEEDDW